MGGYLDYYGIRDWYDRLSADVKDYLYKSCGYGVGTDAQKLFTGDISFCSSSATHFLCIHAVNAALDRNNSASDAFMSKALAVCASEEDRETYHGYLSRVQYEKALHSASYKGGRS